MPASAAGASGSSAPHSVCPDEVRDAGTTHSLTASMVRVVTISLGLPNDTTRIPSSTKPMARFITGPPSMTTIFFGAESL